MPDIYLGDCREILKDLLNDSVDFIAIDPPYGIDQMNHNWNSDKINISIKASQKDSCTVKSIPVGMKFDPKSAIKLGNFLNLAAADLLRVLKPGGFCTVFSQPRSSHRVGIAFEEAGFELRDYLIWDYGAGQGKAQGVQNFIKKSKKIPEEKKELLIKSLEGMKTPQLTPTFETIWLCQKPKEGTFVENYLTYGVGLVNFKNGTKKVKFCHPKPRKDERRLAGRHPTLKPVSLMKELIELFCPVGGVVLDSFAGSGTTGVASIMSRRQFIGIEKDQKWFGVMEKRIKAERA